jgi:hypothetical protein
LQDIDEDSPVEISIADSGDNRLPTFESPLGIGNNGLWIANKTNEIATFDDVKKMMVCLPGSGAVSFIQFKVCNSDI